LLSILAVVAPILAALLVFGLAAIFWRLARRLRRRRSWSRG
jgi:hypothetical protein